jgi:transcriptional regulator with XRE-family HTH domain
MHIGLRIKIARISKGFKQEDLAERINKTRPLISSIEQTGKVNHYTLKKICEVLEIDINELENSVVSEPSALFLSKQPNINSLNSRIKEIEEDNKNLRSLILAQSELINKKRIHKFPSGNLCLSAPRMEALPSNCKSFYSCFSI